MRIKNDCPTVPKKEHGMALVTVVSVVSILTILVIAMLSLAETERTSSVKYADGETARNLADSTVNLAIGQLWEATRQSGAERYIWSSQPGAIRKYKSNGDFHRGYKLYSDDAMVVAPAGSSATQAAQAERTMIQDVPVADWQKQPAVWVDLNEPVIKPDKDGDNIQEAIFPILDPRAFIREQYDSVTGLSEPGSTNVEGFTYQAGFAGVKDPENVTDIDARLPMPVKWLYLLKDGTLGSLDAEMKFVGTSLPTEVNPIVGRVAFWTDDESSKININTASEPTYWSAPVVYHDRDYEWAVYQPTRFEYQRYPGHPATVALSTVLFPNRNLDLYGASPDEKTEIKDMKERIYEIMPKINRGGSESGSVPFWAFSDPTLASALRRSRVDISKSLKEHLYASVDELLFSSQVQGGVRRTHDEAATGASAPKLFSGFGNQPSEARALERMRFFLTAHSRSPETTMFGTPRVAMWPVANETSIGQMKGDAKQYRTLYDNLVAYCSTLQSDAGSKNSYFFRRADSASPVHDFSNIKRNRDLLEYLYSLLGRNFPSHGGGNKTMASKYSGGEAEQILTMIFDYIRSTNLYDGALAPKRADLLSRTGDFWLPGKNTAQSFEMRDAQRNGSKQRTFTPNRASGNVDFSYTDVGGATNSQKEDVSYTAFPGHGQVAPIRATINGVETMGIGRFPTISEVGLVFICTADGTPDDGSKKFINEDGSAVSDLSRSSGGRTAIRLSSDRVEEQGGNGDAVVVSGVDPVTNQPQDPRWYSNYPPSPQIGDYETNNNPNSPMYFKKHPGFRGRNWNVTLPDRTPLVPGQRMVQAMLALEMTNVASGYTGIYPDLSIVIKGAKGASGLRIRASNGPGLPPSTHQLFDTGTVSSPMIWRAPRNLFQTTHNRENGASVGPFAFTQDRKVTGRGRMNDDPGYDFNNATASNTYEATANYDLVSLFFPVFGDTMTFSGGTLTIEVYSGRDTSKSANLVQTYEVTLPRADIPTPELVVLSTQSTKFLESGNGRELTQDGVEAPRWWSFNYGGAIGRFSGIWDPSNPAVVNNYFSNNVITIDHNNPMRKDGIYLAEGVDNGKTLGRFFKSGGDYGKRFGIPRMDSFFFANSGSTLNYPGVLGAKYGDFTKPNQPPTLSTGSRGLLGPGVQGPFGQDTVISVVPKHGDVRLLAAKRVIPASDWEKHPLVGQTDPATSRPYHMAHTFMRFASTYEEGVNLGSDNAYRYFTNARYTNTSARPDYPPTAEVISKFAAQKSGDYDSGQGSMRDGPWINKPDEGNTGVEMKHQGRGVAGNTNELVRTPTAYYDEMWRNSEAGESFLSPNRMVSSAGMFGSLPTGVKRGKPWQTLLFRPWVSMPSRETDAHEGSPNVTGVTMDMNDSAKMPFAGVNPADHFFMDLFWMPVVEPYAISETFSTAGKVNMNFQMVPFNNYIRRATGLHAVMKDELIHAYPNSNVGELHSNPGGTKMVQFTGNFGVYHHYAKWSDQPGRSGSAFYSGTGSQPSARRYWHRKIDLDGRASGASLATLAQFDNKFNFTVAYYRPTYGGLFRTASQICEMHMVPKKESDAGPALVEPDGSTYYTSGSDDNPSEPYQFNAMGDFWRPRAATGENVRERTYANLYAKLTTKSDTYRVHYRVQVIRKARSSEVNKFDLAKDSVVSDLRGSSLVERRLDPNDPRLPDYGEDPGAQPLDNFYNIRVLENKRFAP